MKTITYRDPRKLKEHPKNIFRRDPSEEFIERIREHGIQEPLRITADGVVISGHRRRKAAIAAGMAAVPCIIEADLKDDLAVEGGMLLSNDRDAWTEEEKTFWVAALFDWEKRCAESRKLENLKKGNVSPVPAKSPDRGKGDARKKTAEVSGWGEKKVDQAVKVVEAVKKAESEGNTEKANEIRRVLGTQSVNAAHRIVKETEKPTPKDLAGAVTQERKERSTATAVADGRHPAVKAVNKSLGELTRNVEALQRACPSGGHYQTMNSLIERLINVLAEWKTNGKDAA